MPNPANWLSSDNSTQLFRKLVSNSLAFETVVNPNAPINTVPPALDNASPEVGDTITADEGTWDNSPTGFAWRWYRDSTYTGVTSESYGVTSGDIGSTLKRRTIASNAFGNSAPVFSDVSAVVPTPSSASFLLLFDGASFLLLADGTSKLRLS